MQYPTNLQGNLYGHKHKIMFMCGLKGQFGQASVLGLRFYRHFLLPMNHVSPEGEAWTGEFRWDGPVYWGSGKGSSSQIGWCTGSLGRAAQLKGQCTESQVRQAMFMAKNTKLYTCMCGKGNHFVFLAQFEMFKISLPEIG